MNNELIKIKLKDGEECIIKFSTEEDAQGLILHNKQTSRETEYMARYEDEITMTVERQKMLLNSILKGTRVRMIVAVVNDEIVGNASIGPVAAGEKYQHRATMGIAVKKEYWGQGIGSAMISEVIKIAKELSYEQIELEVVENNKRAIKLYDKYGFQTFGRREKSLKFRDGHYVSEYLMLLNI